MNTPPRPAWRGAANERPPRSANGTPNAVWDGDGLGIDVVHTVPPVGKKNTAHGNDDPTECFPAYLC